MTIYEDAIISLALKDKSEEMFNILSDPEKTIDDLETEYLNKERE